MFMYVRSEQCDLGPIYTITNTQRIRIYPGRPGQNFTGSRTLYGKHAKENQTLFMFLTAENFNILTEECKYGAYSDLSSYAVNLHG